MTPDPAETLTLLPESTPVLRFGYTSATYSISSGSSIFNPSLINFVNLATVSSLVFQTLLSSSFIAYRVQVYLSAYCRILA